MTQTIDRFRPSTLGWLKGSLAGWGTLLLLPLGVVGALLFGSALVFVAALIVALVIIGMRWFANLATSYELTDDRLILHKGIIAKSIDEVELYRIKDVRIDFSIVNQLAGIGRITITSSDETTRDAPLVIRDLERARERRETIRELVNAARLARGVREIDMVHEDLAD